MSFSAFAADQTEVTIMTDKELRKLSRTDLLEILLEISKENSLLREKLEAQEQQLQQRQTVPEYAASGADAPMEHKVFFPAEESCGQYREDMQLRYDYQEEACRLMEKRTRERCEKMLEDARRDADAYWEETWQKVQKLYQEQDSRKKRKGKLWSGL